MALKVVPSNRTKVVVPEVDDLCANTRTLPAPPPSAVALGAGVVVDVVGVVVDDTLGVATADEQPPSMATAPIAISAALTFIAMSSGRGRFEGACR